MRIEETPQDLLMRVFQERTSLDRRYSLRMFARDMGISPQHLSDFLKGKRGLSREKAFQISTHLDFNPELRERFLLLSESKYARSQAAKQVARRKLLILANDGLKSTHLSSEAFHVIANWYHYALVELIKSTPHEKRKASLFAKRLKISENEVRSAFVRLERLNLISRKNGVPEVNQDVVLSPDGIPSEALRSFHRQVLEKAIHSLQVQALPERSAIACFMPIHPEKIPLAKKLIRKFTSEMMQKVSSRDGEKIYVFSSQFFRVTD